LRYIDWKYEKRISIGEFFIMRKYRLFGIGKEIAEKIFNKFPQKWYVEVLKTNKPATSFWNKVIKLHTESKFEKIEDEDKLIFLFENNK
jgi:predicted acetyltransferase